MNSMKEFPYEIGTDEVAIKLGLSPRSVRRLGEKNILEGRVEITSVGKQWFFSRESVESLVSSYEAKRQKEERHRTAKDAFTGVPGQPRTTEDTSEASRPPPLSDEKRVQALEDLLEQEQTAHAQTREKLEVKLESKEKDLLETSKQAAKLEGEKEAYSKYADEMKKHQMELMGMLQEALKLAQPSTTDSVGHETEDNRGQLRPAEVESEVMSERKPEPRVGEVVGASHHPAPPQSSQNERGEDFPPEEENSPSSMSESHREENFGVGEGVPPPQDYGEDEGVVPTTSF